MHKLLLTLLLLVTAPVFSTVEEDYGLVESKSIKVGGVYKDGPARSHAYLSRLRGPNGEKVVFDRKGSCCDFQTANSGLNNTGYLDRYQVSYSGLAKPIFIYINIYDEAEVFPVKGFTLDSKNR